MNDEQSRKSDKGREGRNNTGSVPSWSMMGKVYEGRKGGHTEKWGLKGGV